MSCGGVAATLSLSDDLRTGVDDILSWAAGQPPGKRTGREILCRYGAVLHGTGRAMTRFMNENYAAFNRLGIGTDLRYQFRAVADAMTAPDHDPLAVFHARQALLTMSWSVAMMGDLPLTDEQCNETALTIALGIYNRS